MHARDVGESATLRVLKNLHKMVGYKLSINSAMQCLPSSVHSNYFRL